MAIQANRKSNTEKPAIGNTNGLCIGIYAYQDVFKGNVSEKLLYLYEIEERYKIGERAGKRMLVSTRLNNYISPAGAKKASRLRTFLIAWKGNADGDDLEADVGRPGLVNLVASDDGQYVNVGTVGPLPKGMTPLNRETDANYMPDWIKDLVKGKTEKASDWTPEVESHGTEPENPATGQEDPLEAKREGLRARFKAVLASGAFSSEKQEDMKARVTGAQLPSIEFMVIGWEGEAKAFTDKLSAAGDKASKDVF